MNKTSITKQETDACSRSLVLMFNRVMMYQSGHPQVDQAIDNFHQVVQKLLESVSPLTFIHNHDQFFIEQEPVDPRINIQKISFQFKKTGIQSLSFEKGLDKNEIRAFLEIYDAPDKYPDADAMKQRLKARRVQHLKINHVIFIRATEDEELVSRDAIKTMSPELSLEAQAKSKKVFLDMILESVLSEEFEKKFVIENLMNNPAELTKNMVDADLTGYSENYAKGVQPGQVLLHQLDMVKQEVDKQLSSGDGADLPKMAAAVSDLQGQLKREMEAQKANHIVYSNETLIMDKANEIRDNVLVQIIKNEAGTGEISDTDVKQVLQEYSVDEKDVARILPKAKTPITDTAFGFDKLLSNPEKFSENMVRADLADAGEDEAGNSRPGKVLLRQLEILKKEVEKNLSAESDSEMSEVAAALFGMKKQLIAEMESQKALKIAYSNEAEILGKVNDITDSVLLKLLKEEYQSGKVSTPRLAQIIRRLVPDADELKRLLPKIKTTLLGEGMPLSEYVKLVQELGKELQNEELAKILQASAEEIGMDGEALIQEIKKDPAQATALISLASEIRNSTGDEKALSDLLLGYVEQLGAEGKLNISRDDVEKGDQHLREVVTGIESKIFGQLKNMNIKDDIAKSLEARLNDRMDEIFEKVKLDIIKSKTGSGGKDTMAGMSILEILIQNVGSVGELGNILDVIRNKARSEDIDQNNFEEIYEQISEEQKRRTEETKSFMSGDVLNARTMITILKKEMLRAKRYRSQFVVLAFSLVSIRPQADIPPDAIPRKRLETVILNKLLTLVRASDVVGMLGKSKTGILLPHTTEGEGEKTLRRCIRMMHSEPIQLIGLPPIEIKLAGIHSSFDLAQAPDADAFIAAILNELTNLERRVKNIQSIA